MSQSRNAKRSWEIDGAADGLRPPAPHRAPRSKFTQEPGGKHGTPREGLQPGGAAYRIACRLFPGFAELPAPFRATLDGYAPLFAAATGPLSLREHEVIALAVTGRESRGFGGTSHRSDAASGDRSVANAIAFASGAGDAAGDVATATEAVADEAAAASVAERERVIASFASKVTRRWLAIGGADVEALLDAGLTVHAIRSIAETAAVFHFLAEISAAMLLRPRLPGVGRAPIAAVASKDPSWKELSRWLA